MVINNIPEHNLESNNNQALSIKDLIQASLTSEQNLEETIVSKYNSIWLWEEAKEELSKLLNVFKKEISIITNESNNSFDKIKNNTNTNLEELKSQLSQNYEIQDKLDEFNDDLFDLSTIENNLSDYEWYDNFIKLIRNLWDEKLEEQVISKFSDYDNFTDEVLEDLDFNWLPIDENQLSEFIDNYFWNIDIDTKNEINEILNIDINTLETSQELEYTISKINTLIDSNISDKIKNKLLIQKTKLDIESIKQANWWINKIDSRKEIEDLRKEKLTELVQNIDNDVIQKFSNFSWINNELKWYFNEYLNENNIENKGQILNKIIKNLEDKNNLDTFVLQAQESWDYKQAYDFLINVWKISQLIKQKISTLPIPEYVVVAKTANAILWKEDVKQNWAWDYITDDWVKLSIENNSAKLYTFSKYWYTLKTWEIKNTSIINDLSDNLKIEFDNITEVKSNIDKLNERKNISKTKEEKEDIQKEIDNLILQYNELIEEYLRNKKYLDDYVKNWGLNWLKELEEKQEKQKKTLKFLGSIGFDLIPQSYTNMLLNDLKSNIFDINWLDLYIENLDLEKWRFWESPSDFWWTKWMENLIKFFEKMIYWEVSPENSIFNSYALIHGWNIKPMTINTILEDKWIKTLSWWFNIIKMRENLSKKIEE